MGTEIVTVIMPVAAAHRKFVQSAIDSIYNQTAKNAAIILAVNDSGAPLRVRGANVINTTGQKGAAYARNMALDSVRTPFVTFLDADDLMVNTALETLLRAYAGRNDANYLYGDGWTTDADGRDQYYNAPLYDRQMLFRYNLHNVTALVPTETVRKVGGFDEKIAGWEDWEFYIRLGVNGFCGAKVPTPLILYRLATGISRETHRKKQDEIYSDIKNRFGDYIDGRVPLMACCGSNANAQTAAQLYAAQNPALAGQLTTLEYIGDNLGTIPFRVNGNTYRGANTAENKFVTAPAQDVAGLVALGVWRAVPQSALMARKPVVTETAEREDPRGIDVTTPETTSAVSVPQQDAVPEDRGAARKPKAKRGKAK